MKAWLEHFLLQINSYIHDVLSHIGFSSSKSDPMNSHLLTFTPLLSTVAPESFFNQRHIISNVASYHLIKLFLLHYPTYDCVSGTSCDRSEKHVTCLLINNEMFSWADCFPAVSLTAQHLTAGFRRTHNE